MFAMEIASRILVLRNGTDSVQIPVRVFAPSQREPRAWSCQYQIEWPEGKETREMWGVDSIQALVLALQAIGSDIYTSSYHKTGDLLFETPGQGYGFPVPVSLRDHLVGNDAKLL
jgi:hypothetical protein